MKIGIVGANSDVGIELSLLLRASGTDVVPLIRDELAAAFFEYHGFDSKIFSSSSSNAQNTTIESLDAVVIAARSNNSNIQKRQEQNDRIIQNTVANCGKNTRVIYLSSLAALGKKFYGDAMSEITVRNYIEEKRRGERVLQEAVADTGLSGYALRLGIVAGPTQEITKRIASGGSEVDKLHINLNPKKPSNVVHTVTVREAVEQCASGDVSPGTYTLVNVPQWSWKDVVKHSIPTETTVLFYSPEGDTLNPSLPMQIFERGWKFLRWVGQDMLYPVRTRVPYVIEKFAVEKGKRESVEHEIKEISKRRRSLIEITEGKYNPVGETNIPSLSKTDTLVEEEAVVSQLFGVQYHGRVSDK